MSKLEIKDFFDFRSRLLASTVQAHAVGLKKDVNGVNDHWNLIKGNKVMSEIGIPINY
jgi:hypothetical protein